LANSITQSLRFQIGLIAIAVIAVVSSLVFLYSENEETVQQDFTTQFKFMTWNEYYDEELRKSKTENPNANKILFECGIDEMCATELMLQLSRAENKQTVLGTYHELLAAYLNSGLYCHAQGHHFGKFLYGYIGNVTEALSIADVKCGGSQRHGVIENYFLTEVILGKSPDDIEFKDICEVLGNNVYSLKRVDCAHGIGHGITKTYDHDVFAALKRCEELETRKELQACNLGVFMENELENGKTGGGTFEEDDVLYPCNKVNEEQVGDCYMYQTSYIMRQNNNSAEDTFKTCDEITDKKAVMNCYYGTGRILYGHNFHNLEGLASECQIGNPEFHDVCLLGALLSIADMRTDKGFEFCKVVPEKFKTLCYDKLGRFISTLDLSNEEKEKECLMAENQDYSKACTMSALGVA